MQSIPQNNEGAIEAVKKNSSVLYVEDQKVNREVVAMMLKTLGCHVDTANDGHQAIEMFTPGKYDIIFMDIRMPGIDGIETTKKLLKKYGDTLPPVVAISASVLEDDREKILDIGMVDLITKPVSKNRLSKAIETHGQRKQLE